MILRDMVEGNTDCFTGNKKEAAQLNSLEKQIEAHKDGIEGKIEEVAED